MMKRIIYSVLCLSFLVSSCEDVYIANLDQSENQIVIEAKVTNNSEQNLIHISRTLNFYEEGGEEGVIGAEVTLVDEDGLTVNATDNRNGYYIIDYSAVPGKRYKLKIKIGEKDYESDFELLPPLPQIQEFDVKNDTVEVYKYASDGEPMKDLLIGVKPVVDLSLNELSYFFFKKKLILEYIIHFEGMIPPPPIYGWQTFDVESRFNIVGSPEFGDLKHVDDHKIGFNYTGIDNYLNSDIMSIGVGPQMVGWILILDQFGVSEKTFNFYKTLNAQLEAEGKLFDPVYPQINTNIRCTTDLKEKVIGYFELSSHRQTRYFYSSNRSSKRKWYEFDEVNNIPFSGMLQQDDPPEWWEFYGKRPYGPIVKPNN